MNAPTMFQAAVLVFGAYRLTRLVGWDDFPPVAVTRAWILGERWVLPVQGDAEPNFAGKQPPDTDVDEVHVTYDRPLLAHLVHCPFCVGWWISLAVTVLWVFFPTESIYTLAPFALSGAVGIIAKNLDA